MTSPSFNLETSALSLSVNLVPWDAKVFGFPVAVIDALGVIDSGKAALDFEKVRDWLDAENVRIISCRLPHEELAESFFLESQGFRFVEMVLHPQISGLSRLELGNEGLFVDLATTRDIPTLSAIAASAFGSERYHVDPRVDTGRANVRYAKWVEGSFVHPQQRLLKVVDGEDIVALFIIEVVAPGKVYWHLTAVAPRFQGKGMGWRSWRSMMHYHQSQGIDMVETTISARNSRVLNLYARLGFRFSPPEMTFHYVR
jgi:RimJ/RimL family protein N-acetyltransferase